MALPARHFAGLMRLIRRFVNLAGAHKHGALYSFAVRLVALQGQAGEAAQVGRPAGWMRTTAVSSILRQPLAEFR
jgi:hypothetical protein